MGRNKLTNVLVFVGMASLFIANPVLGFIAVGLYIFMK